MNDRSQTAEAPRRRRRRAHRATCPISGKIRYRDDREADDALHQLLNQAARADELGGRHRIAVRRKYRCSACKGWHLTSWSSWGEGPQGAPAAAAAVA